MSEQTILDRYTVLLQAYALQPDEKLLAAAAELSREMAQADMSLEAIIGVHLETLQRLAQERPDMTLPDALCLVLPFLKQLMTAGDLAHRERLASARQLAESLRQNAAEYRAIFETTGTAMLIIEEDTTISLLNTEGEKLYGYSREEVEGKRSWVEFVVPDDLERMKEYHRLRRSDPSLAPQNYEFRLIDKHGAVKDVLLFIDMIPGTGKSVASLLDITQRNRAEKALKRRATQLATVAEIGRQMATFLALDPLLEQVVTLIREVFGYRYVSLFLVDPDREELVLRAGAGYEVEPAKAIRLKIGAEGICGWVAAHGEPLLVGDVSREPRYYPMDTLADTRSELALPVRLKDQITGVLDVQSTALNAFDEEDIFVLQLLSDQVAVALENTRLFEAEQRRRQEAETLQEAALSLTTTLERNQVIERILYQLQRVVPYDSASVQLLHGDQLEIIGERGFADPEKILGITFDLAVEDVPNVKVMGSRVPLILEDASAGYDRFKQESHARHIHGWLGVPLLVGDRAVGMLALDKHEPGFYTEEHAQLALAFAAQAAIAIENARLFQAEQEQRELAEALAEAAAAVGSTLDLDEVFARILEQVARVVPGDVFNIMLLERDTARAVRWQGYDRLGIAEQIADFTTPFAKYPNFIKMVESGKTVFVPDTTAAPDWVMEAGQEWRRSYIGAPIQAEGATIGFLNADGTRAGQFSPADVQRLEAFTGHAAIAIQNARLYQRSQELVARITRLYELSIQINETLSLEEALELVARQVIKAADAHSAVINLLDQEGHLESHLGMGADGETRKNISPPRSNGTTMSIYRTGAPLIANDLEAEDPLLHPSLRNKGIKAFIGLPLKTRERCTGVLFVRYAESHLFSEEEVQALSLFANQAAVALENARLYHAAQRARERADALREISRVVGSTLELNEVLSLVLRQAKRVLTYDSASILLFDNDQSAMAAVIGYEDDELVKTEVTLRLGDSPILQGMARDHQPVLIADAREEERWVWVSGAEGVRAWLGVPLLVRDEMIGVLMVDSIQPGLYTADDVAIAQSLASQVAVAIENARLYTLLEQEKSHLELLHRLSHQLSESLDVHDVAQRALDELCTVVGAMRGITLVRELDRARLQLVAVSGYTAESLATLGRQIGLGVGNGLIGRVVAQRQPLLVTDVLQDEYWAPVPGLDDGVRSALSVPLFSGAETIGAFSIYSDQAGFFNDDHRQLAESVAATVAVAIQNARLYQTEQRRSAELRALYDTSLRMGTQLEAFEELLRLIVEQAVTLLGAEAGGFYLYDPLRDELVFSVGIGYFTESDGVKLKPGEGLAGKVFTSRRPLMVDDYYSWSGRAAIYKEQTNFRTVLGVPLLGAEGVLGVLDFGIGEHKQTFDEHDLWLAELFAAHASVAIQNARLYEQAQHRLESLSNLNRASQALTSSLEVQAVLEQIVGLASSVVNSDYTSVALLDEKGHLALEVEDFRGLPPLSRRLRPGGVTHQVLESGQLVVMDEIAADGTIIPPLYQSNGELLQANPAIVAAGIRSAVAAPIQIKGKTLGVLFVHSRAPRAFQGQLTLLSTFANQAAVALENARLYERAQQEIAERKRTQDALRASEEQYRLLTETARDLIVAYDMTGRVTYANPAAWEICGYDEEEFRQLHVTAFLPPEQLSAMRERAAKHAAGDAGLHVFEADLRAKSGRLLPVEVSSSLLLEQDRPVGALLIARDITERRRAQEALQRRATQLATLGEVGQQLASLLPLDPLLERIVNLIREAFAYRYVVILLVDPLTKTLEIKAGAGFEVERVRPLDLKVGEEGICGWVAASGESLLVNDVSQEPRYYALEPLPDTRSELAVPIRVQDQVVGVLNVQSTKLNAFDQADIFILQTLADQTAVAIENARLFEAEQCRRREAETLREAALALTTTLERSQVIERILIQLREVAPYDSSSVQLLRDNQLEIIGGHGFPNLEELLGVTFDLTVEDNPNREVVHTRAPLILEDAPTAYSRFTREPHRQADIHSWLGVPMLIGDQLIGIITLDKWEPGFYTEEHARLAEAFAAQAAVAIENARLFEAEQCRRREAETLRELSMDIASTLDFDQLVERATHILARTLGVEYLDFVFPDPDGEHMVTHPSMLGFIPPPGGVLSFPIAHSITGRVYRTGQPALVPDVSQDPDFRRTASSTEVRSELAVPVKVGDEVVAVLNVESRQLHKFTTEDLNFLSAVAAQLAVAMKNARLFQAEREQRELSESLVEAAVAVGSTLELDEVLDRLLEQVERVLPGDACNVMLIEGDIARMAHWRGYRHFGSESFASTAMFPLAEVANLQQMIKTGKPVMISDTATYSGWVQIPSQAWLRSYLGTPIQVGGVTVGFLNVDGSRPGQFDSADARRLEAFAHHAATAIENAGLYRELRSRAAQLEERVTERTAQLQAQYARLDALLRSVSDGILVTDAQGDLIQTNPVAQRWLTQTLSAGDAERLQTLVRNLARRAQERPEAVLELSGLDLQLNAAPILEREAEEATAVVVAHDVSHIKALERMKSRFVTNVSHELRTPITTIKLYVALMQQKPKKWEKYLDALTQETEQLARLVEDVLQVSRIDAGRLEIHPQPTSLNVLTKLIVSKHQVLARSGKVTLSYQPAEPGPRALADPDQLTQALNNLVRNAIHYTPKKGKVIVSTGTAESRGRLWATMKVADTGMGIPSEELPHIFERFFRGQQPQSLQLSGSGLGLPIVHEIVELHGGRVTVDSQVGAGSTFTIWLPLLKE